jgi:hypothetical protein
MHGPPDGIGSLSALHNGEEHKTRLISPEEKAAKRVQLGTQAC